MTGRRARAAAAVAAALAAAACDDRMKGGGDPYAEAVRRAVPRVEEATGLKFRRQPRWAARPREEIRRYLAAQLDEPRAAAQLAGTSATYKRLGLIPDSVDVRRLFEDLLTEQVAGYYDPKTDTFYFVQDGPPEMVGLVASHELVHALQDQYLDLDSLQRADVDADRQAAAQAALEGQATYAMVGGSGMMLRTPNGWERAREAIRQGRASTPVFGGAPAALQEELVFPYIGGADFVRAITEAKLAPRLLRDVPRSTEQVLHPADAYVGTRDEPTTVRLPAPRGGALAYENTLGEFTTRLALFQFLADDAGAARGARGWDGDRFQLVRTARGDALVWVTVWDSPLDAAEFHDLYAQAIERRWGRAPAIEAGGVRRLAAGGRQVELRTATVGGRPAVMYVDAPDGAAVAPPDPASITLDPR